jgi:hypothetical protein
VFWFFVAAGALIAVVAFLNAYPTFTLIAAGMAIALWSLHRYIHKTQHHRRSAPSRSAWEFCIATWEPNSTCSPTASRNAGGIGRPLATAPGRSTNAPAWMRTWSRHPRATVGLTGTCR